jgi:hypothetical protein
MSREENMHNTNIHTKRRMPDKDSGRVYSCGRNNEEGSQSNFMLHRVSLYSIGHTKYWYWHMMYDIWKKHKLHKLKEMLGW